MLSVLSAIDFHAIFPSAALTPELEKVGQLEIVIYKDGWPGIVLGKPGVTRKPNPGTWDVCVRATDGSTIEGLPYVVYGNVPVDGSPLRPEVQGLLSLCANSRDWGQLRTPNSPTDDPPRTV